jgi:hypothetical protein
MQAHSRLWEELIPSFHYYNMDQRGNKKLVGTHPEQGDLVSLDNIKIRRDTRMYGQTRADIHTEMYTNRKVI